MQKETKESMLIIKTIYLGRLNDLVTRRNYLTRILTKSILYCWVIESILNFTKVASKKPSFLIMTPVLSNSGRQILQTIYQLVRIIAAIHKSNFTQSFIVHSFNYWRVS